jgi:hypothetical protein
MLLAVLVLVGALILNIFLPWWSIAIPGLILGYQFKLKPIPSFLWGFHGVFFLWAGQALYFHIANSGILSSRIAEMLGVGSPWIVIFVTGVLGGLVSGLATMTGSLANQKKSTN